MPATQRSASSRETFASSRIDSSTLRAIIGIITLSSNDPCAPPNATAASLPITWAATMHTASGITGFTLPGMIEEPGCRSGRLISASPARGPDPIHRRSLAILCRETATTRSWPDSSTSASRAPCASKWLRASVNGSPVRSASSAITSPAHPGPACSRRCPPRCRRAAARRPAGRVARSRSAPCSICAAYPANSWPSVTGVASIRWVRPAFTTSANSAGLGGERGAQVVEGGQQLAVQRRAPRPRGSRRGTRRSTTGPR